MGVWGLGGRVGRHARRGGGGGRGVAAVFPLLSETALFWCI